LDRSFQGEHVGMRVMDDGNCHLLFDGGSRQKK